MAPESWFVGRRGGVALTLLLTLAPALGLVPSPLAAESPVAAAFQPATFLPDAELNDICFADPDQGWAVGDRGVIWRTRDGGKSWKLQSSPVVCRWEAVSFVDAQNGWIVGSRVQPYTQLTSAVVLRTRDGGARWSEVRAVSLPGLRVVKFFDTQHGWAAGDVSPLYPTGVFRTNDGGNTWTPLSKGGGSGWVAGDFRDARSGALAGLAGEQALAVGVEVRPSRTGDLGARFLRRLKLGPGTSGWLVGDGGLLLSTRDSGYTWTEPETPLPYAWAQQYDFRALAVLGRNCWLAGAPGTAVFHSPDGGATWSRQPTGVTAPLLALHFLDESRGWAVGALGTILATRDGGKTWRVQQQGGARAAVLALVGVAERAPWEALAHLAGNEGYLAVVEALSTARPQQPGPSDWSRRLRFHDAVVAAGGSAAETAWRFPAPEAGLPHTLDSLLAEWNRATDGKAAELLEAHLVRRIRQWRPEVVLTDPVNPRGDDPLSRLTSQLVLTAAAKAGDPAHYPEQLTAGLLTAWAPQKVIAAAASDRGGEFQLAPAQWAARLGCPLTEQAENGRALLLRDLTLPPPVIRFSLLVDRLPHGLGGRDFFSGLTLPPGSDARRQLSEPAAATLRDVARQAQQRQNAQQLLERIQPGDAATQAWIGQAADLTRDLPSRAAGDLLFQLGRRYHEAGQSERAADVYQQLVERTPEHPLAPPAAVWLVQYYASSESAWRHRKSTQFNVQLTTFTAPGQAASGSLAESKPRPPEAFGQTTNSDPARTASTAAPLVAPARRAAQAQAIAQQLEQNQPLVYAQPSVQMPLLAALAKPGVGRSGDRLLSSVLTARDPAWVACGEAEQWLATQKGVPPKKIVVCMPAAARPRLDGRLDDPLWQATRPVALASPRQDDADWPAVAALAYDREFLYVALSCRRIASIKYDSSPGPRSYDSALAAHDHVQLHLDRDRDYASYFTLAVDARGHTADNCFGDVTWNPAWYVAAGGDDAWWTAEIAIPWEELGPAPPQPKEVWALGVTRLAPGGRLQSVSQPAAASVRPEGFALLAFE